MVSTNLEVEMIEIIVFVPEICFVKFSMIFKCYFNDSDGLLP